MLCYAKMAAVSKIVMHAYYIYFLKSKFISSL